ncbi:MarP family serine protease [Hoyosella rhizosphaerae]|uniref:Acid resistance periplasmic serine protease MarP n=1 Tax=Hoyosella rhizosphaerae TaxID=1755582 RepID=A0A916UJI4_9ACTN|nr:MarP family serine protease [Hoyosella rhizosphaerae]MBN4925360.1 MarP family serine protease [Hoyosella rhizosphaerae]GGC75851.1 acid resistance periplasmic serine protease MarP [Hoyosella rhizosphaerae]
MTGSQWIDLILLVGILLAAISGWRHGALASGLAFIGVVVGAVFGIMIAPHVVVIVDDPLGRLLIGIVLIVVLVVIGEVCGMVVGRTAKGLLRVPFLQFIDSLIGAIFQAIAILLAAYLLAIPAASSGRADIAAAVRGSNLLSQVDQVAPQWLKDIPKEFATLINTSGLPDVLGPFGRTPITAVEPPDGNIAFSPVVTDVQRSVPRVRGTAQSCLKSLEGSGIIVAPSLVMTNAHVVAGTEGVTIETLDGVFDASVVVFDPAADIAILRAPGLPGPPLRFVDQLVPRGTEAVVVGYPGGGPYTANAVRVRDVLDLTGPDIYQATTVNREVYTVRGTIRQGNSGGPLLDADGNIIGVVFGAATDDPETGFVLTNREVAPHLNAAFSAVTPVGTGACV